MAFWRIGNNSANLSAIDKLLDRPDHTLVEVLEEPDLLQELLGANTKLIDYLRDPEVMRQLVRLVSKPDITRKELFPGSEPDNSHKSSASPNDPAAPKAVEEVGKTEPKNTPDEDDSPTDLDIVNVSMDQLLEDDELNAEFIRPNGSITESVHLLDDSDEDLYYENKASTLMFASISSDILSADVWLITEALVESTDLMDEIWTIVDFPSPIEMTHATYFTKINEHLLDKKTDETIQYIKSQKNFVKRFIRHIDNPPLMDFLLKVISSDKPDNSTGIIEFLQHQQLIPSLISCLDPKHSSSIQTAAGDFLKAFVTISANSNSDNTTIGPNELTRELVSEPRIRELVRLMLYGGSGLATGVGVVIEIIRKNNSDYDFFSVMQVSLKSHPPTTRDPIYLGPLVKIFAENMSQLTAMLVKKHDEVLKTPFGEIEPLGFERFKICELVAELLHCSNMVLLNDAGGEAVVRTRDLERIRVRKHIAESQGGYPPLPYTESPEEKAKVKAKAKEDENRRNSDYLSRKVCDLKLEEEKSLDAQKTKVVPDDGHTIDSDVDDYDDFPPLEIDLRINPVVGDILKISLADNQIITHILNLFFKFPWNNFLHNVVFDVVQQVLNGSMTDGYNRYLAISLFQTGRLIEVICEGQIKCAEYVKLHNCRLGYMGHLTLISEEVVKFTAVYNPESISPIIEESVRNPEWIEYVSETLTRTREQYNSILGGQRAEDAPIKTNPNAIILRNDEEPMDLESTFNYDEADDDDHNDEDFYLKSGEGGSNIDRGRRDVAEMDGSDKFSRYVSEQMAAHGSELLFGSSDEEDDDEDDLEEDELEDVDVSNPLNKPEDTGVTSKAGDQVEDGND